jgi:hypothetical protein
MNSHSKKIYLGIYLGKGMVIRLKRLLSILLTLILICSLPLTALAVDLYGCEGQRLVSQYISDLAQRGLLTGTVTAASGLKTA